MRPTDLLSLIKSRFEAGIKRPLHIESSPGLGKTQIARQAARDMGVGFKIIHAPTMQPEDYGFPVIAKDKGDVNFIVSKEKFPVEGSDCPDKGILLIDEMPQADNAGQKVLANLVQEREIHGQHLKAGWTIITTGNRTIDRSGANRLLSHLKNRITTVELEVSLDDWCDWAATAEVPMQIVAFLRFKPNLLNAFDPQQEMNPTPRSWAEGVGAAFGKIDRHLELQVFRGDVGEGAAAEFCAFIKTWRELLTVEQVLEDPQGCKLATRPDVLYAMCGALTVATTPKNFEGVFTYVKRMPPEFTVLFIRDTLKRCREIATNEVFRAWARGPGKDLLT